MGDKNRQEHARFDYENVAALQQMIKETGVKIPVNTSYERLRESVSIGSGKAANRLSVLPMEGCDAKADGSPSSLTVRRYKRFAQGGAGLIWVEATAVVPAGKANPRQLILTKENLASFQSLAALIDQQAAVEPYKVLQLTHSGRYSRPVDKPAPQVAGRSQYLDKPGLQYDVLADEELDSLIPAYVKSAKLAQLAGFNAVDIKACHGYLISELLGARYREGRYGGSFENRTRFLLNIVDAVRQAVDIDIAVRLNAYDELPHPYGWGVRAEDCRQPDWNEMTSLLKLLEKKGVTLVNLTGGNPYYNPHVNRPYDSGPYKPPFHQLIHAEKLFKAAMHAKQAVPGLCVMATGFSWFRDLALPVAAGLIERNWCDLVGFGRQAFAYPDFAKAMLSGHFDKNKCCIACGKCSEIMRDGGCSGCVVFDREIYQPIYREGRAGKPPIASQEIKEHV